MQVYNKLVRDKIPEIIENKKDGRPVYRIMNSDEYLTALNTKLKEELNEYLESGAIEELADLEEVLLAILEAKNVSFQDFEKIRLEKSEKRGGFKKRIFLESVEEME